MSQIDDLIKAHRPSGVNFRTLGEMTDVVSGATPSKAVAEYWLNGTIPWLSSGEVNKGTIYEADTLITQAGYDSCSTRLMPAGSVVVALAGQGKTRGTVARTRLECCTNQSLATIVPNDELDSDFLFHFLRTQYTRLRDVSSGDGSRGGLNLAMIRAYRIPVPPLEVQREIVRILDPLTQLEADLEEELEAELEARTQQYTHYRPSLLMFGPDADWFSLNEIADYANGKAHEKLAAPDGTVPMVTARFVSRDGEANRFVRAQDVLMPADVGDIALVLSDLPNGRALARTFYVDRANGYAINQRVARIRVKDPELVDSRYLFHVLDRNPGLLKYDNGADQTHLSKSQVTGLRISVPPIDEQRRVAQLLDQLKALIDELKANLSAELSARRKHYVYYRDKLLTFEEAAA